MGLEPVPAVIGSEVGYTLDRCSPSLGHTETDKTNNHPHAHSLLGSVLETSTREPEYPEGTHAYRKVADRNPTKIFPRY